MRDRVTAESHCDAGLLGTRTKQSTLDDSQVARAFLFLILSLGASLDNLVLALGL